MNCMLCQNKPELIKCIQCQIPMCRDCASFYLVGNGCSPSPVFLCPDCLQEYSLNIEY